MANQTKEEGRCWLCGRLAKCQSGCPSRVGGGVSRSALRRFIAGYEANRDDKPLPALADTNDKSFALGWRERNKGLRLSEHEGELSKEGPQPTGRNARGLSPPGSKYAA